MSPLRNCWGGVYFQLENFQKLGVYECEPIEGNNKVNVYT